MSAEMKQKLEDINNDLLKVPQLKKIQDTIGIPVGFVIVGVLTFAVILVGFAFPFSRVIVTIIGVVYPVWKSCEAVESEDTLEDDKQWLTYWSIFGFFSFVDNLGILSYIPMYFLLKLLFLIWLQNPMTNGASKIYNQYVRPLHRKHYNKIEDFAEKLENLINSAGSTANSKSGDKLIQGKKTDTSVNKSLDET